MRLQVLTDAGQLEGKKIYCFGKNFLYISEMLHKFKLKDAIAGIIDNNPRTYGEIEIEGKVFSVVSPEKLQGIDYENSVILITSSFYKEIYAQLCAMDFIAENMSVIYQYNDRQLEIEQQYVKKYKDTPLEDIIIFRSGPIENAYLPGTDFADNARALFEYMIANRYNEKYKLVWFVKYPCEYNEKYKMPNVEFVTFDWASSEDEEEADIYYRNLLTAKYIFFTDAYGFAKCTKSNQIRIQLWHGCGYKTRVNFAKCEKRYEYTTVVSDLYAKIHQDIYGLREDQMLVTGYAKHDWLYQPYKESFASLLGISETKKYIFWLPTFRMANDKLQELNQYELASETGLPIVNTREQWEKLDAFLKESDMSLIVKLHPFQKRELIKDFESSNIKILDNEYLTERDLVINRLLASVDAFISDYSSAAIDFLNVDKPIAFTLDDEEEYKNSRGFVFENIRDWLPGKEIFNFEDFFAYMQEIAQGEDSTKEKRHQLADKMLKYRDNQNCKRILDALHINPIKK